MQHIRQKTTVMSGTHRFNTNYSAEEAGKVVFKHCRRVIYLPKRYVEQMSDGLKSLGWILQLLSSLWCFSEAVLLVFIHLPLESQLNNSKKKVHDTVSGSLLPPASQITSPSSPCYYFIFTFYFYLRWCQHNDFIPDIKSNETAIIPSIPIQSSAVSSI